MTLVPSVLVAFIAALALTSCGGDAPSKDGGDGGAGGGGGAPAQCSQQSASCSNGESCCDGLTCCRGVPVPVGKEYCGAICPISDRNMKKDFAPVNGQAILRALENLPISTWTYNSELAKARHIGPMAQDFMATFEVGSSDQTILQVDADGVAFAAIKALHEEVRTLKRQNLRLARQVRDLRTQADSR